MNLYLISQTANHGFETYDSAVVTAESEEEARRIYPDKERREDYEEIEAYLRQSMWTAPENVSVKLLAENVSCTEKIVCASFNAG